MQIINDYFENCVRTITLQCDDIVHHIRKYAVWDTESKLDVCTRMYVFRRVRSLVLYSPTPLNSLAEPRARSKDAILRGGAFSKNQPVAWKTISVREIAARRYPPDNPNNGSIRGRILKFRCGDVIVPRIATCSLL